MSGVLAASRDLHAAILFTLPAWRTCTVHPKSHDFGYSLHATPAFRARDFALRLGQGHAGRLWRVTEHEILEASSDFAAVAAKLGLPIFVTPALEGSSLGITKVKRAQDLRAAYELAAQYRGAVIAEKFIDGPEYTAGVLGARVLPIIRIEPATEFYDYQAKYFRDDTQYHIPCGLGPAREAELQVLVEHAMHALGCEGWGRCDFMLDRDGKAYLLEVNTSPGMTSHSLVPTAARAVGVDYPELCWQIMQQTLQAKS